MHDATEIQPVETQYAEEVDSDEFQFKLKPFEIGLKTAIKKICCLICITYPIFVIFIAAVLSVPLTYLAEWPAEESFFELLVELSSSGADNVVSQDLGAQSAAKKYPWSFYNSHYSWCSFNGDLWLPTRSIFRRSS